MKKYIKIFELFVSIAVTGGFLYLFYVVIGFEKLLSFITEISAFDLFLAFVLYTSSYITRTFRWKITLEIKDFKKLFKITSFNTVFNIFLPFRTGELSFFYMLKKENIHFKDSAFSFFTVRVFDAIALFTVFISSLLFYKGYPVLGLILMSVMPFSFYLLKFLLKFVKIKKFQEFNQNVLTIKNLTYLYGLSLLTFILKFSGFYFVIPEGINLSFLENFFAAAAGDLTTILPIHGIAGIGTYEGGYAGILVLIGIDKDTALLSSVFVHIFILLGAGVIAAFSYIFLRK
ncbi:lysylphosphatidylglycerol synthase transmembrane domain-containing protein [Persephonella sp.]